MGNAQEHDGGKRDSLQRRASANGPQTWVQWEQEAVRISHVRLPRAVDTLRISNMTHGDFDRLVQEEGVFSKIEQALERGKGLIFVTAHLGNWELITHVIGAHGYKGGVIGRRIYYEPFNRVLERIRRLSGAVIIYRDESPRSVLQILRKNQVIGMLPDQDVDNIEGIFIPFFGKDAYTLTAPAKFAYASGAPILPVFMVREGLRYRLVADELLWSNHQNEREKEIERLTTAWSQVFESMIRRYPEQWVWMHRRWKTQPAKMSHSEVING